MIALEKLARMLSSNFGTSAPFDDAMLAEALRVSSQPDAPAHVVAAFLRALADAFDGVAGPRANISAGRKGKQAALVTARGVTDEALAVHDFITDAVSLADVGTQEKLIEKVVKGDWPGGKAMSRAKVMDHLKDVRAANARVRVFAERRREGRRESTK